MSTYTANLDGDRYCGYRRAMMISWSLVIVQLAGLAYLAATGPWWPEGPASRMMMAAGVALGGWSLLAIRLAHLRIRPEPHPEAGLWRAGPYRFIRHPMYTALILVVVPLVGAYPTPGRLAAVAILMGVLGIKIAIEERMLAEKFAEYADYCRTTGALLPRCFRKG